MSDAINLKWRITYPREAVAGFRYLLSIDLDHELEAWPYDLEEYPVTCFVDVEPYFDLEPIGSRTIVVHRFGGSYGPAQFWLRTRNPGPAAIRIVLANSEGIPIGTQSLDDIRILETARQPVIVVDSPLSQRAEHLQSSSARLESSAGDSVPGLETAVAPDPLAFRWIHLSSLYCRSSQVSSEPRPDIARDLAQVMDDMQTLHAVIVTGNITFSGADEEFDVAGQYINQIRDTITRAQGYRPRLLIVPGPNDYQRAGPGRDVGEWNDPNYRAQFWAGRDLPLRRALWLGYSNYSNWCRRMEAEGAGQRGEGLLPGDFSVTFEVAGRSIGVIGLNDAFLPALSGEDRTDLNEAQIRAVCRKDVRAWAAPHELRILLTHHSLSRLSRSTRLRFFRDIAPPWLFGLRLYAATSTSNPVIEGEGFDSPGISAAKVEASNRYLFDPPLSYRVSEFSKRSGTYAVRVWTRRQRAGEWGPPLFPTPDGYTAASWQAQDPPTVVAAGVTAIFAGPEIEGTARFMYATQDLMIDDVRITQGVARIRLPVGEYRVRHVESGVSQDFKVEFVPNEIEVIFPPGSIFKRPDGSYTRVSDIPHPATTEAAWTFNYNAATKAEEGDPGGAMTDYTGVIEMPNPSPEVLAYALYNRGVIKGELGDPAGELADYNAVIELPNAPTEELAYALYNRAYLRGEQGDVTGEIADYTRLIELPNAPPEELAGALNNRGLAKGQQGDPLSELADYQAVSRLPGISTEDRARALYNIGVVSARIGRSEEAIVHYSAVIDLPDVSPELAAEALAERASLMRRVKKKKTKKRAKKKAKPRRRAAIKK